MTRQEIIAFMNQNPASFLATVANGTPHVRGIGIYRADESGILFHTGAFKNLYRELTANPEVEFCFYNPKEFTQVRVSGVCEEVRDDALKQEILGVRVFLKDWVEKNGLDQFILYRMKPSKATVWTMATNFQPNEYIPMD